MEQLATLDFKSKSTKSAMINGDWRVEDCQNQAFKFICAEKHTTILWNSWQEWSSCSKTC